MSVDRALLIRPFLQGIAAPENMHLHAEITRSERCNLKMQARTLSLVVTGAI
jgi:hypothetical protein